MHERNVTILLFAPDRATRQLYARALGNRWQVIAVEQSQDVLTTLAANQVQAVVLEPGPSDNQGWELLAKVREQAATSGIPIIMCSAVDERGKGYALGASAYLVKPVPPHQLVNEVARWLEA